MKRLSALQSRSPRPYDSDLEPIEKSAGLRQIWASLRLYVTLIVYLTGVLLSAFAWDLWSKSTGRDLLPAHDNLEVHPGKVFGVGLILTSMLGRYRQRSILALVLMVA
jgi:hypothetical protein